MRSLYPWPIFPPDLNPQAARSLSLQLALQEWLISFEIIDSFLQKAYEANLDSISNELQKFLLFSLDNPFAKKAGTLDKLCFYIDELTDRSRIELKEPVDLILNEMRDVVLAFRQKLLTWKRRPPTLSAVLDEAELLTQTVQQQLKDFHNALLPFFEDARSDENVLFYLIEHRDQFNQILTPKKIEELLCHLYPTGPAHLRAILCEGYTRRGFSEFYAKHEALIDSIEWTADICIPALH